MSTGNMPEPPDTLTSKTPATPNAEALGGPADQQGTAAAQPLTLSAQMAATFAEQADLIAQRLVFNTQVLYGVSAIGVDFVNARNSVLVIANALRSGQLELAEKSLMDLGYSQIEQVNDHTLPFKNNSLVAGMLEGILLDTVARSLGDGQQLAQAREMLGGLFERANARTDKQSLAAMDQWPGGGPNARS